ncbi:MAG: transcriptional regulator [Anaerolineae bacterium]|nr:transcriptional regulator [Anaerolineae bacterium]
MNEPSLGEIFDLDRMIHEPARLMILILLTQVSEVDFVFLLNTTGLTRGNLSSHLSRLEESGFIQLEKRFVDRKPQTVCWITDEGKRKLANYTAQLQTIMTFLE